MAEFRRQVVWAVGWKIIAELFRRHHADANLRLYETHPGGGQYDCLSLYAGDFPDGTHLCDLNQASSHFHIFGRLGPATRNLADLRWPNGNDYVTTYLQNEDPKPLIDDIETVLGLPARKSSLPATTAPVLSIRLISEILAGRMLDRFGLDVCNGFFDTSGMAESRMREELRRVPAIAAQLPSRSEDAFRFARRFWVLRRCASEGNLSGKVILDMRGTAYSIVPPYKEVRFWQQYRADRQIRPLVAEINDICGH